MSRKLSRREFLKLLAGVTPGVYLSRLARRPSRVLPNPNPGNVLIIVFDALSARNISLYGYRRNTMPNLARMAEQATVYHNHYAGGNFTIPGTASLLTGTYPWTHRAVRLGNTVAPDRRENNIFNLFDGHYRVAYSHNPVANTHLYYFSNDVDELKPQNELFVRNDLALDRFIVNDYDLASVAWERSVKRDEGGYSYSLFFSNLYEEYGRKKTRELSDLFPLGAPRTGRDNYFLLEQGVDWLLSEVVRLPQPFLAYFHFLPPHAPYAPRRDYAGVFRNDGLDHLITKPKSIFSDRKGGSPRYQSGERQRYDEFILYADGELGRLYDHLRESRLMENTWIVFTSDHGEMFERGIYKHGTPVLYEPIVRVPLLILEPGQERRQDIYTATSAVDVLQTLAHVTGQKVPEWVEGEVLPPFSGKTVNENRSVYAVEAKDTKEGKALSPLTGMVVKGKHKLTYFSGYSQLGEAREYLELYDLEQDPEEMNNLYSRQSSLARELREELTEKIREADKLYRKK